MKKLFVLPVAMVSMLAISACTQTQQNAAVGAAAGGVLGGVATGSLQGAAIGAGVGAVAGVLVGQVAGQPEQCYYRNSAGELFIDACPAG